MCPCYAAQRKHITSDLPVRATDLNSRAFDKIPDPCLCKGRRGSHMNLCTCVCRGWRSTGKLAAHWYLVASGAGIYWGRRTVYCCFSHSRAFFDFTQ